MAIILETRGSAETSSSGVPTHPWRQVYSIPRTVKSEISRDTTARIESASLDTSDKKQLGNRILKKFFSNLTKSNKMEMCDDEISRLQGPQMNNIPMGPATYLKPLEHKLVPRLEPGLRKNGFTFAAENAPKRAPPIMLRMSMYRNSMYEIALNRANAARILTGEQEVIDLDSEAQDQQVDKAEQDLNEVEVNRIIKTLICEHNEQVISSMTKDKETLPAWRDWIKCYRKARFNLNKPPFPPETHKSFSYLQAVFPSNEVERRAVCESLEVAWVQWQNPRAAHIVTTVMNVFGTHFASISFFDHDNEIFKVENGFDKGSISRSISIAAHALLSDEVFVILDTKKDWRFANNPLATEKPGIRFFAGAPMLSESGHAVGVLAVFGKDPRTSFSTRLRRQLADYASAALDSLLGNDELLDRRSTPILQRDSVINGDYHAVPAKLSTSNNVDNYLHFPLKTPRNLNTPALHGAQRNYCYIEQTPPSTASDDGHQIGRRGKSFGDHEKLSVDSAVNLFPSLQDLITPDSPRFESPSPRPFSSSDITSLNLQPVNTPRNSVMVGTSEVQTSNVTIEAFLALSDEDCIERLELDSTGNENSDIPSQSLPLIDLSPSQAQTLRSDEAENQRSLIVRPRPLQIKAGIRAAALSDYSQDPTDVQAAVAFACHYLATNLGFDLIYVAEIIPKRLGMSDKELLAPGGIEKRVLAAHGVVKPLDLSSPVHLEVLRTRGGFDYALNSKEYNDDEFELGYLIPLHTELGALRLRSSGLVVGAYKKRGRDDGDVNRKVEADKLRQSAEDLKPVFLKATHLQLQRSSTPNPYPANEAVEIGHPFTSIQESELHGGQQYRSGHDASQMDSRSHRYNSSENSRPSTRQQCCNLDYSRPESRSTRRGNSNSGYSQSESRSTQVVSRQRQRH